MALGAVLDLNRGSAGAVLRAEQQVLARGWAESVAEREPGVASVSAAVVDRRGVTVAAVSVSGPLERLTRSPGRKFGAAAAAAANQISRAVVH